MKTNVYCLTTDKGVQNFYLEACGETYYLFSQNYRRSVKEYFDQGVHIDAAIDFSRAHHDTAILHTGTRTVRMILNNGLFRNIIFPYVLSQK